MSSHPTPLSNDTTAERARLVEQMQFLGQMLSTETAMFHQTAAGKNGLTITDSKTLSVLMQEGSMTAGQLAQRLSLTTGAITNVIDHLEQAGFAHRTTDPTDRRKVIVQIEHGCVASVGQVYDSIGEAFERLLSQYSLEQLRFLAEFYEQAIELTKQEIAQLKTS